VAHIAMALIAARRGTGRRKTLPSTAAFKGIRVDMIQRIMDNQYMRSLIQYATRVGDVEAA
jgi:hypothetical protein